MLSVWCVLLCYPHTGLSNLLQQRRRWINGTVAGYIWLLQNRRFVWNSSMNPLAKLLFLFLTLLQVLMYWGE